MSDPRSSNQSAFSRLCVIFSAWVLTLVLLGVLDVIDFHVCIKNAGHCKIIDPTKFEVVPK